MFLLHFYSWSRLLLLHKSFLFLLHLMQNLWQCRFSSLVRGVSSILFTAFKMYVIVFVNFIILLHLLQLLFLLISHFIVIRLCGKHVGIKSDSRVTSTKLSHDLAPRWHRWFRTHSIIICIIMIIVMLLWWGLVSKGRLWLLIFSLNFFIFYKLLFFSRCCDLCTNLLLSCLSFINSSVR